MSGVVSHIAIGGEILKLARERIKNKNAFLTGNIAPDGVHFREGYQRPMKKLSHLRQGIDDRDFLKTQNLDIFHQRLRQFEKTYCIKGEESYDFMCGYVSHLITDELYIGTVRENYVGKMSALGIDQRDIEFFHNVTRDMTGVDAEVAQRFAFNELTKKILADPCAYEVKGLVKKSEVCCSMAWIEEYYFRRSDHFKKSVYLTYDEVSEFIGYAAGEVFDRLCDSGLY